MIRQLDLAGLVGSSKVPACATCGDHTQRMLGCNTGRSIRLCAAGHRSEVIITGSADYGYAETSKNAARWHVVKA